MSAQRPRYRAARPASSPSPGWAGREPLSRQASRRCASARARWSGAGGPCPRAPARASPARAPGRRSLPRPLGWPDRRGLPCGPHGFEGLHRARLPLEPVRVAWPVADGVERAPSCPVVHQHLPGLAWSARREAVLTASPTTANPAASPEGATITSPDVIPAWISGNGVPVPRRRSSRAWSLTARPARTARSASSSCPAGRRHRPPPVHRGDERRVAGEVREQQRDQLPLAAPGRAGEAILCHRERAVSLRRFPGRRIPPRRAPRLGRR